MRKDSPRVSFSSVICDTNNYSYSFNRLCLSSHTNTQSSSNAFWINAQFWVHLFSEPSHYCSCLHLSSRFPLLQFALAYFFVDILIDGEEKTKQKTESRLNVRLLSISWQSVTVSAVHLRWALQSRTSAWFGVNKSFLLWKCKNIYYTYTAYSYV